MKSWFNSWHHISLVWWYMSIILAFTRWQTRGSEIHRCIESLKTLSPKWKWNKTKISKQAEIFILVHSLGIPVQDHGLLLWAYEGKASRDLAYVVEQQTTCGLNKNKKKRLEVHAHVHGHTSHPQKVPVEHSLQNQTLSRTLGRTDSNPTVVHRQAQSAALGCDGWGKWVSPGWFYGRGNLKRSRWPWENEGACGNRVTAFTRLA